MELQQFKITTINERLENRTGIKAIIMAESGMGKTPLIHTLNPKTTLFIDVEGGSRSAETWGGDVLEVRDFETLRSIVTMLHGPVAGRIKGQQYSQDDYDEVVQFYGQDMVEKLRSYKNIFIDSLSRASKLAEDMAQAKAIKENTKNGFQVFTDVKNAMVDMVERIQYTKGQNIFMTCLLKQKKDKDGNQLGWETMMIGRASAEEIPTIIDYIFTLKDVINQEGKKQKVFVTRNGEKYGNVPARSRDDVKSGEKLGELEAPDVTNIMKKLYNKKEEVNA